MNDVAAQYRDSSNLSSRQSLHDRYGSGLDWHKWIFDLLKVGAGDTVLEAGCGPGYLWRQNLDRLPDARTTLTDMSAGMVAEARSAISSSLGRSQAAGFAFAIADMQSLPFAAGSFTLVTANHMLYHVPDLDAALAEVRRVLAPGGRFVAATNGLGHMAEVRVLIERHLGMTGWGALSQNFSLDDGAGALGRHFRRVDLHRPPPAPLLVTEVEPLLAYIRSTGPDASAGDAGWRALVDEVALAIQRDKAFRISREQGAFVCLT